MKITTIVLACLVAPVWLSACGNKGDLTLDDNEQVERDLDQVKDDLQAVEGALTVPQGADDPAGSSPAQPDTDAEAKKQKKTAPVAD